MCGTKPITQYEDQYGTQEKVNGKTGPYPRCKVMYWAGNQARTQSASRATS